MKPFSLSILKCTKCPVTSDLSLNVSLCEKIEDIEIPTNLLTRFPKEKEENLKIFNKKENLIEGDFYEFSKEDLGKVLFGNEIIEGSLECSDCKARYPIKDGISDFVA